MSEERKFVDASLNEQEKILLGLATKALSAWNLTGELSLIKQRENAVYSLLTTGGDRFALRVHRANYHSNAALNSEGLWMQALSETGLAVPVLVPTSDGNMFTVVDIEGIDQPRQVDLLAWLDGEQIGTVENGLGDDVAAVKHIYTTIGQIAAKVHNQSTRWKLPEGFKRHSWDEEGLVGEQPLWGRFWELGALSEAQHSLILRGKMAISAGLKAFGKTAENYSLIHADFVPENVMVHNGIVQIIDFDDAGFGWHMFELATALYFIQEEALYGVAKEALIQGYRSQRTLAQEDLDQMPLFLAARSLTYLGWVHTRQGTETANELTPLLIEMSCNAINAYLESLDIT